MATVIEILEYLFWTLIVSNVILTALWLWIKRKDHES